MRRGQPGPYQVQAAIAAVHADAATADATDWSQIVTLYDQLYALRPNAVVALNRAIAAAMVHGPQAGLELLGAIDGLAGHYRLDAVRAHLLEMAGDTQGALEHYRAAAARTTSLPEQHYLAKQAARLKTEAEVARR